MTRLLLLAAALLTCTAALAQNFPTRPIRIVVPFAAGGPADITARNIGPRLTELLGQPIIVDNRGGANGIIGIDIVSKAPADGYTLLSTASVFAINPAIYRKLPYDTEKDFVPIANFVNGPGYVFVAHPSTGAQT